MDPRGRKCAVIEEIVAKEPNLSAQPNKPVLKKPGAPSRFRSAKRMSGRKMQPSEKTSDTASLVSPVGLLR